jgi:hypothetical protein
MIGDETALAKHQYCPLRSFGYSDQNLVGRILDLQSDLDQLQAQLKPSCRNSIRRAQREGCSVRSLHNRQEWLDCLELARQTLGPQVDSEEVHAACWDHFVTPGYAYTYAVTGLQSNNPINLVVSVGWQKNWYYWKSFNNRNMRIPGANNLALWEAIVDTKRRGGAYFELGSVEFDDPKQKAISDFKSSFGGTPTYFLRGIRYRRPVRHSILELLSVAYGTLKSPPA